MSDPDTSIDSHEPPAKQQVANTFDYDDILKVGKPERKSFRTQMREKINSPADAMGWLPAIEYGDILEYRKWAGIWAGIVCTLIVVAQYVLLYFVGRGWLDFGGDGDLLKWILVTNFGEITGLLYVVFRFLFGGHGKDARRHARGRSAGPI